MKVTLNDITNLSGNPGSAQTAINSNFQAIEDAIENTLSRDGTTPNQLNANLDANSKRIINLPAPVDDNDAARIVDVQDAIAGVATAATTSISDSGDYFSSSNVEGALQEIGADFDIIEQLVFPRTDAEIAASITPTDYSYSFYPFCDVRRYGAVQDGSDQSAIVQTAINAVAGSEILGTSGGTVFVPMGVAVTLASLTLKKNVTLLIDNGQTRQYVLTGYNVSGAVSEQQIVSNYHPALILDVHTDLDSPALGAGQVLSYRASIVWRYNGTSNWQLAQDINADSSTGLTLYALNSSKQVHYWDHAGNQRLGRRTSQQDFSAPKTTLSVCKTASIVADDTETVTFTLGSLPAASTEAAGSYTHRKAFQLQTNGDMTILDDAATTHIARITNAGTLRSTTGVGGGAYTTAARNALTLTSNDIGIMVYDTTLGKPVWLHNQTGPVWHDATGASV